MQDSLNGLENEKRMQIKMIILLNALHHGKTRH